MHFSPKPLYHRQWYGIEFASNCRIFASLYFESVFLNR